MGVIECVYERAPFVRAEGERVCFCVRMPVCVTQGAAVPPPKIRELADKR